MCYLLSSDFLEPVVKIATVAGIIIALIQYRKNSQLEKAKWLAELYKKFYEEPNYKKMRAILDYPNAHKDEIENLKQNIGKDSEIKLQEELVDYLNFFEFIATLEKLGQLETGKINLVFGYYIKLLDKHEFVQSFISQNEFKNLQLLITKIKSL